MIQLAYSSNASPSLGPDDIFKIIETSARNNMRDELTGFLVYAHDAFFQVVEGPPETIEDLLGRLRKDARHANISILWRSQVDDRSFPRWQMKRLRGDQEIWCELERAAAHGVLRPALKSALSGFLSLRAA